ncbi:unnamed protein product [Hermetia illucens]|uniref:Rho-GAP domain-containing protein n=1 Tax=Hermetia illucens TaxID=343691 RepID=A0A7R8UUP8_HERIL|nr:unnamed protein product [Hermetia illucens]
MNCLGDSRKDLAGDRYSKSTGNLHDTLMAELQTRLQKAEVKSCENLISDREPVVKHLMKKSQSFRSEKPTTKLKKSETFSASPKGNGTIYGTKLSGNQMDYVFKNVPKFLVECCKRIEGRMDQLDEVQGVYRVPGEFIDCVNILAGAVKLFLRESQTPLVSSEEIQQEVNREKWCSSSDKAKCDNLRMFFTNLDPVRKGTLEYILRHLKRLCDTYPEKLNSKNFAISIGPAIIHINSKACLNVTDTLIEHDILNDYLEFMIDNCFEIFKESVNQDDDYGEELILETTL